MVFYSAFQQSYLWLPFIGLFIGLLATMVGSGGGFFFPVILILFYHIPAHVAVATSLAVTLPICIVGSVGHFRKRNVITSLVLSFGIAGVAGALIGVVITRYLSAKDLKVIFGIYLVLLSFLIFLNNRKTPLPKNEKSGLSKAKLSAGSAYGLAGGIISGTFGTGGVAPVLAGLMAIQLPVKMVVGTSLKIVLINTITALTGHIIMGEIDLSLVFWLSPGTIIGALAGPFLLAGIKLDKWEMKIRNTYAFVIIVIGIIMITSNGLKL
jgi:uncharacterized membrane protein YfcA